MLTSFNDSALKQKLISLMLLTSSIVLLVSTASFFTHEMMTYRKVMRQELQGLADVLGNNAASALVFNDQNAAEATLKGLNANPRIQSVLILNDAGRAFAEYGSDVEREAEGGGGSAFWDLQTGEKVAQPITVEGREVGTVVIQSNMQGLREKIYLFFIVGGFVMLVTVLIAYFVSARLQGLISEPIMQLVQTMKRVSLAGC